MYANLQPQLAQPSTHSRKRAMKRLRRDLIEVQSANLNFADARPLDDNLFEWHANIRPAAGPYSGISFHFIFKFLDKYPADPPTVTMCPPIKHPNICGGIVCLEMLRVPYS